MAVTTPIRTCAGCGRKAPQNELQRYHSAHGELVPGAGDGRGVYTCRRLQCFERAASLRAFNRTLRENLRVDLRIPASLHWTTNGQRKAE